MGLANSQSLPDVGRRDGNPLQWGRVLCWSAFSVVAEEFHGDIYLRGIDRVAKTAKVERFRKIVGHL